MKKSASNPFTRSIHLLYGEPYVVTRLADGRADLEEIQRYLARNPNSILVFAYRMWREAKELGMSWADFIGAPGLAFITERRKSEAARKSSAKPRSMRPLGGLRKNDEGKRKLDVQHRQPESQAITSATGSVTNVKQGKVRRTRDRGQEL